MYNNPNNSDIQVNFEAKASASGTYAILVTGWSNPDRFDWDIVPNLIAKGSLFSAKAGTKQLVDSICANPSVDRVYFLALTKYDLVSGSFKAAYRAVTELGVASTVSFSLPILPIQPSKPHNLKPRPRLQFKPGKAKASQPVFHYQGSDLDMVCAKMINNVTSFGTHYPSRGFTSLPSQVAQLTDFKKPEYHSYFDQWLDANPDLSDVRYTYGSRIQHQTADLVSGSQFSTQRVISLLLPSDLTADTKPCLTQLSVFDNQLTAVFRSHELVTAWRLNVLALQYLHYLWFPDCASRMLIVISLNAHIYDFDLAKPLPFVCDPIGYFTFSHNNNSYQIYLNDNLVAECGTKSGVMRWVSKHYPGLDTSHAFWIANTVHAL